MWIYPTMVWYITWHVWNGNGFLAIEAYVWNGLGFWLALFASCVDMDCLFVACWVHRVGAVGTDHRVLHN